MKFILFIILLTFNLTIAQETEGYDVQNEPERLIGEFIVLDNSFVISNKIKKISFFRDEIFSSSNEFDFKGNLVVEISKENSSIEKSIYSYDNSNNNIKTEYYKPNGEFNYGYTYTIDGNSRIKTEIGEDKPYRKTTILKDEHIEIYSNYKDGKWVLSDVDFKNDDNTFQKELNYNDNGFLYQEYVFYYDKNSRKGGTVEINYDENGKKESETNFDIFIKDEMGNEIENYSGNYSQKMPLSKKSKYNLAGKILKEEDFSIDGKKISNIDYVYDKQNQIIEKIINNHIGITKFKYLYSKKLITKIIKESNKGKNVFNIKYELLN